MKKRNGKFLLFLATIALIFSLSAASVFASVPEKDEYEDLEPFFAAESVYEVLDSLNQSYFGEFNLENLYNAAAKGLSDLLDDYSEFMTEVETKSFFDSLAGNVVGIGITLGEENGNFFIKTMEDGAPAHQAGVKRGDIIKAVNGVLLHSGMDAASRIRGAAGTTVKLTLTRNGEDIDIVITRSEIVFKSVAIYKGDKFEDYYGMKLPQNAACLEISRIGDTTGQEFKDALKNLEKDDISRVILDLRGNGGGYLNQVIQMAQIIVPKGKVSETYAKSGNQITYRSQLETCPFSEMYVLVDGGTASAAELLTGAIQDSGIAVIIGEQTYGKGVFQSTYTIPFGGSFKVTEGEYFTRDGRRVQGVGITPDIKTASGDAMKKAVKELSK